MLSTVSCCLLLGCRKALLACPLSHRQLLWPRYRYNLIMHSLMLGLLDWWVFFGHCKASEFRRECQEKQGRLQPCMYSQTLPSQAGQKQREEFNYTCRVSYTPTCFHSFATPSRSSFILLGGQMSYLLTVSFYMLTVNSRVSTIVFWGMTRLSYH